MRFIAGHRTTVDQIVDDAIRWFEAWGADVTPADVAIFHTLAAKAIAAAR